MNIKNKLISLINVGIISVSVGANQNIDWLSQDYYNQNCVWRSEGCVKVEENEIDFRSNAKKILDKLFECKNTIQGCTQDQQEAMDIVHGKGARLNISQVEGRSITGDDLSDMIAKSSSNEVDKKSYYIPLNLTKQELLTFAATTSLGLVVFANDQEIMDFVQETKTEKTQKIADISNLFGRELVAPVAIGSYFLGVVFKNGELKDVGLITVSAQLATGLITEGFKKTFSRVRPNGNEGPYEFGKDGNNSFFSGHTSAAFSLATVISETFKEDHKWVPYVAYGAAALTAYARMHDEKHWGSDVLFGALFGHYVTKMVYRIHKKNGKGNLGLMVYPAYNAITGEFSVQVTFTGKTKEDKFDCEKLPQGREKVTACIEEAFERSK